MSSFQFSNPSEEALLKLRKQNAANALRAMEEFRKESRFLPALPQEGYLEAQTTTVAEGLGIFKDIITADGEASPA